MPLPTNTVEQAFYIEANQEKTIREISRILADSVSRRHDFFSDSDVLTVSSAEHHFSLISSFEMLNSNVNPVMDHKDPNNKFRIEHYFWFLNENAEKYHKELCYEGYYG